MWGRASGNDLDTQQIEPQTMCRTAGRPQWSITCWLLAARSCASLSMASRSSCSHHHQQQLKNQCQITQYLIQVQGTPACLSAA